ncbi:hypothetical protein HPG69_005731 [Diceros bicornis minor]|uniref:Uncharacterized protein n=1 Tax=Diceros bicornis minor TaxID=77932 RepID=A0A7J7ES95_DICBM|nr:hypothetical protein HPG69_005731 [Diceros bicornis minor]
MEGNINPVCGQMIIKYEEKEFTCIFPKPVILRMHQFSTAWTSSAVSLTTQFLVLQLPPAMRLFSVTHPAFFLLTGTPDLERSHSGLAGPLSVTYAVAPGGITMIIQAVLNEPMCYFLSMLSFSDVAMSMVTLHTVLRTVCLDG